MVQVFQPLTPATAALLKLIGIITLDAVYWAVALHLTETEKHNGQDA